MGTARMESSAPGDRQSLGDADMMESFNQLQLKCAYMEAEVLEASTGECVLCSFAGSCGI
jgi:hypothetical protein